MLPLITAALGILQSKAKDKQHQKDQRIAAAGGDVAQEQGQAPNKIGGVMDILGKMGMGKDMQSGAARTNGLSTDTSGQLDSLFGSNPSSEQDFLNYKF